MTVSMEGIQGIPAAFAVKELQQGTGALSTGEATPFAFTAILNQISGALNAAYANANGLDGSSPGMAVAGGRFEAVVAKVETDGISTDLGAVGAQEFPLDTTLLETIANLLGDITDATAKGKTAALGCNDRATSELERIIGAVAAELRLRAGIQSSETGALPAIPAEEPGFKQALRNVDGAEFVQEGQTAADLQTVVGAVMSELKRTGSAGDEAAPTLPGSNNEIIPATLDPNSHPVETVMNLIGGLEAVLSGQGSSGAPKGPTTPVLERIALAVRTGTNRPDSTIMPELKNAQASQAVSIGERDFGGILNSLRIAENAPQESNSLPRAEAQSQGSPLVTVVIKNESGETEIDLTALKTLLNEGGPASPTGKSPATSDQQGNQDPIRQNLIQALTRLNEGKQTDVIAVKFLQAGSEKTFSLRQEPNAASASALTGTADTGETVSSVRSDTPFGDKLSSALNFGQSGDKADGLGKQSQMAGNQSDSAPAWRDSGASTFLKGALTESEAAGAAKDSRPVTSAGEVEQKAMLKAEAIQSPHRGEQVPVAGVHSGLGNDRKEIQIEPQAVIRQVAEGAEEALNKGASRIRMELTPPRLGTLDMDLMVSHDRVRMVIMADSQDARNILQSNMDQLRSSLQQQGLKMDGVEVFVQDRSAGGQSGNLFGHAWGQPGAGHGGQFQEGRNFGGNAWSEKTSNMDPVHEDVQLDRIQMHNGAGLSVFA